MIRKHYSGNARRARNFIWNAAGRYDFEPPYLAFYPTGEADMYFNMVIGLAAKWFELEKLEAFFDTYAGRGSADEYDELLWLGIENCVYEKEVAERPILSDLRRKRAEDFFRMLLDMSRQQMEMQSMLTYEQQKARWSEVLGKRALLTGKKKRISEALHFPGSLDTEELISAMQSFLIEFFRYKPESSDGSKTAHRLQGIRNAILRRLGERRGRSERLMLRVADGGGTDRDVSLTHTAGMRFGFAPGQQDEDYIRAVFGECIYREREMRLLESSLCVDADAASRIWVSDAGGERAMRLLESSLCVDADAAPGLWVSDAGSEGKDSGITENKEARDLLRKMTAQRERNRRYKEDNALLITESVKRLTAGLDTVFSDYARHLPVKARAGRLMSGSAYRMPVLHDPYVFIREGDEIENRLSVTLLLDASMSRIHAQELIAAESYVIARSLMKNQVPVQILSYRTIRGFTVIQRLKGYGADSAEGVLNYVAGGWNRDALAFRLAGELIREQDPENDREHLLIILTDANPNDSMPLAVPGAHFNGREYEGALSVREAQRAVKALRESGIRTSAVFLGAGAHLDNVHQIFSKEYVRISKISQLADGVSLLIEMMLREDRPTVT